MASVVSFMKADWDHFRHDPPGHRFENHTERVLRGPRAVKVLQLVAGLVVMAAGLVMLVIPGPGLPVLGLGLAMVAGGSRRFARLLDHGEQRLRRLARSAQRRWRGLGTAPKVGLVATAGTTMGALAVLAVVWFF